MFTKSISIAAAVLLTGGVAAAQTPVNQNPTPNQQQYDAKLDARYDSLTQDLATANQQLQAAQASGNREQITKAKHRVALLQQKQKEVRRADYIAGRHVGDPNLKPGN